MPEKSFGSWLPQASNQSVFRSSWDGNGSIRSITMSPLSTHCSRDCRCKMLQGNRSSILLMGSSAIRVDVRAEALAAICPSSSAVVSFDPSSYDALVISKEDLVGCNARIVGNLL